jgi:hypothetical protein
MQSVTGASLRFARPRARTAGRRWWKIVGLAGLAGVAATGVVVARNQRRRHAYRPDEIRTRLQQRHAQAVAAQQQR